MIPEIGQLALVLALLTPVAACSMPGAWLTRRRTSSR